MKIKFKMLQVLLFIVFSGFVSAEDYRLGGGDIVSIAVWEEPDLTGDFKINSNGTLVINWLDPIDVSGLSVEDAKVKILDVLSKKYVKNPKITSMSIKEYSSNKVLLMGEVKKPGDYKIDGETTLLKVILSAGGPNPTAADDVILIRNAESKGQSVNSNSDNLTKETFSLHQLMAGKEPSQNVKLINSDVIYIPSNAGVTEAGSIESGVTVLGAVNKMGIYKLKDGYTAMNAIIDAGGFTKFASKNRTVLVRGKGSDKKTITVKMGDVMEKGDKKKDLTLEPGDIIIAKEGFL